MLRSRTVVTTGVVAPSVWASVGSTVAPAAGVSEAAAAVSSWLICWVWAIPVAMADWAPPQADKASESKTNKAKLFLIMFTPHKWLRIHGESLQYTLELV